MAVATVAVTVAIATPVDEALALAAVVGRATLSAAQKILSVGKEVTGKAKIAAGKATLATSIAVTQNPKKNSRSEIWNRSWLRIR